MSRPTTIEEYRTWLAGLTSDELKEELSLRASHVRDRLEALAGARKDADDELRWLREAQIEKVNRIPENDPPF